MHQDHLEETLETEDLDKAVSEAVREEALVEETITAEEDINLSSLKNYFFIFTFAVKKR